MTSQHRPCFASQGGPHLKWIVAALLTSHAGLLAWGAWKHSPTFDEIAYLPAGISHWHLGRFDLCRVNPPLTRALAAIPVLLVRPTTDWSHLVDPAFRPRFAVGRDFLEANGRRTFWYFGMARCACIPLSLVGGYFCYRWAAELYGPTSGILALTLWSVSPNVLAHGQLITPDMGGAVFGVVAGYAFWRWLRAPGWKRSYTAGFALGLAELARTTWIVLFGLFPILWLVWEFSAFRTRPWQTWMRRAGQLLLILLVGLYLLNVGFLFEGTFQRLRDYGFVCDALTGYTSDHSHGIYQANRFNGTWLGTVPVPFPEDYVLGLDAQKRDFEQKTWSYLRGEWRVGGWWYYYLYALAIKVPLGTWVIVVLAMSASVFQKRYSAPVRDELLLIAPAAVVLTLASSQTGINQHMRYVLPILPFAFVWVSKAARAIDLKHWQFLSIGAAALLWSVTSSLWIYPHNLSYFNELVGGPTNGHAHLLNSNIDWGQDLLYLQRWRDGHPEANPFGVAYSIPFVDPRLLGDNYSSVPLGPDGRTRKVAQSSKVGPIPGWYGISVNELHDRTKKYVYFLRFRPAAMAGYSIYIYHITLEEANRVRGELGLPELRRRQCDVWDQTRNKPAACESAVPGEGAVVDA
jgi:4-amino-4-deoxy-L-arabinose transferase-like glycosyltransferase